MADWLLWRGGGLAAATGLNPSNTGKKCSLGITSAAKVSRHFTQQLRYRRSRY